MHLQSSFPLVFEKCTLAVVWKQTCRVEAAGVREEKDNTLSFGWGFVSSSALNWTPSAVLTSVFIYWQLGWWFDFLYLLQEQILVNRRTLIVKIFSLQLCQTWFGNCFFTLTTCCFSLLGIFYYYYWISWGFSLLVGGRGHI